MDKIDRKIITLLQADGQLSNQDLAEKIALSPSPCLRRVKQLEEEGIIQKYVALLDPEKLGLQLAVFVTVGLNTHEPQIMAGFENAIKSFPEIVQCALIAGQEQDYILKIVIQNMEEYQAFLLQKLTQIKGIKSVCSSFILRDIVNTTALPIFEKVHRQTRIK
ncbi:MAG: Lrp/AsnC family transcriptional regulator [Pseudomonadota bacterium]